MSADSDFPQIRHVPASSSPGSFAEQAGEVVDELWPVILVIGIMMTLQWAVSFQFGARKSGAYILPGYLALAAGGALYLLHGQGHLEKAWECFIAFDEQSKYLFAVVAAAIAYGLSRFSPGCAKEIKTNEGAISYRGLAVESSSVVTYPRELPSDPKKSFLKIHEMLSRELVDDIVENYEGIHEQLTWVEDMLRYNTVGGKMNRGMGVVDVLSAFAKVKGNELSHLDVCRGSVLGWAIEWLQAFFLVADDVMDRSLTRRGQPCWYKVPKVQEIAINDSFILEAHVFKMLKRHFEHEDYYVQLVELFHDVTYRTEMGQLLDLTSQPMDGPSDPTRFTPERYRMIVRYKTAYYTFYLPCAIGMIYAGVKDPASYRLARDICCRIGEFFQIQDDFLDCFGDPSFIGKVGTDIQDNKCSWLVVQALQHATPEQRDVLLENYAIDEEEKIDRVKALYREMELDKAYHEYEENAHAEIKALIAQVEDIPHAVFNQFIDKIYKRAK